MSSIVDKVHAFFDELEAKVHEILTGGVAQEVEGDAKAVVSDLIQTGKQQVGQLVDEAVADAKTDAATAVTGAEKIAGDLSGQPTAESTPQS